MANSDETNSENVHVWIESNGWINTHYSYQDANIEFSGVTLDLFKQMNPYLYYNLQSVHWRFEEHWDQHLNIEFRFFENDLDTAREHAEWMVEFVNLFQTSFFSEFITFFSKFPILFFLFIS